MPAKRQALLPKDVLAADVVTDLSVSPDGASIVFSRTTIDGDKTRSRLWRISADGGAPEQLTFADAVDATPSHSPDGTALLFVSDRDDPDGDTSQAWVLALAGGEPRKLAEVKGGIGSAQWSPDGTQVLCTGPSGYKRFIVEPPKDAQKDGPPKAADGDADAEEKDEDPMVRRITQLEWRYDGDGILDQPTGLWVLNADGSGEADRITEETLDASEPFWSPDGTRVGFFADLAGDFTRTARRHPWSIASDGSGEPTRLLPEYEGMGVVASWSEDGVALHGWEEPYGGFHNPGFFIGEPTGSHTRIGKEFVFYGAGWSEMQPLIADVAPLRLGPDRWLCLGLHRGRGTVFLVDGGAARPLIETATDVIRIATGGGKSFAIASVEGDAADLYELNPDTGELRGLTTIGHDWFAPFHRLPEEILVKHAEGHEIQGWLTRAYGHENERRPVIFEIHGGPYDAAASSRLAEELMLADAGFHVFSLNPRGSISFGEEYAEPLFGNWGEPDADDLFAVLDWAAAEGLADPERVGIFGLSYGGYMVHQLLGAFPGRFKAAISENPFSEAIADLGAGDSGVDSEVEMGLPRYEEDPESWFRFSPSTRIHLNEAPLLLLQADDDLRCPPVHSETVFSILKRLGRTVEMIRYPGEHHIMVIDGRPDRRVDRLERVLDWFTRYL